MDAGIPVYMYINTDDNVGTKTKPVYLYKTKNDVFGDTSLSFHGDASFLSIDYNAVVLGPSRMGRGSERTTRRSASGRKVDQRVVKSYVAVGPMAHFQAGTAVDLPWRMSFEADAYEELPLDNNLVYSTTGSGKKKVTTATNTDPAEDNGFLTSLDIPLSRHVTMSGFYNRSLRDHDDTGGFSFTFLLKAPPRPPEVAF